jgi:putative transposase
LSRKPRIHRPAAFYHVMLRGNNAQDIFFSDRDRCALCLLLQKGVERYGHKIHGFCLMRNHIHLVIQTGSVPLSPFMQHLASGYARYINWKQKRIGHLFQGRFKAILVDAENYLLELIRYVHLNPVRAGIVAQPEQYSWSGHLAYVGVNEIVWLSQDKVLEKFHKYDITARKLYSEYVKAGMGEKYRVEFYSGSHEGRILGDDTFAKVIKDDLQCIVKADSHVCVADIVKIVAEVINLPIEALRSPGKRSELVHARGIAALIVRQNAKLSLKALAVFLGKDANALSKLATAIERKIFDDQKLVYYIEQVRNRIVSLSS